MDASKRILEDFTKDNEIQSLATRHARLFLRTNIWQRPSSWLSPVDEHPHWYALCMYYRLAQRYQLQSPLPNVTDLMWEGPDHVRTADGLLEPERRARILYIASFAEALSRYLPKYLLFHAAQWNGRLAAEQAQTVGKKVSVRGTCFAYVCTGCENRVIISRLFQTQTITRVQATLEHASCYCCYRSLAGLEENFDTYHVHPTETGQIVPSAFSLLEIGLACEALTEPPTVARVHNQLRQDGMNWSKISVQAALHMMEPSFFEPAFVEK